MGRLSKMGLWSGHSDSLQNKGIEMPKELKKDRKKVCEIISEMLDNPDKIGIYPTGVAYQKLVEYIQEQRVEAIGWTHAEACTTLDNGGDIRKTEISGMLDRALVELA